MHVNVLILAMFNVQRAITPKVGKPELQFMCSASCLIMLYIRNGCVQYLLCSKGHNSKSRFTRVKVFVFCMLSHGALQL